MKISIFPVLSLSLCMIFTTACSSDNPARQAPPISAEKAVTIEAAKTAELADPRINVLFVVDNSGSMKNYQDKMAKNIKSFAKHFFSNSRVDYRIGVVPVYDSKYLNDTTIYRSGPRIMNALGELVPLKGLQPDDTGSRLFITRDTLNPEDVLTQTVVIGTQWGPEAEESFTPVLAVADDAINAKNEGFYQKDAYLAVIFLTDADDVSPGLSGEDFYKNLIDLKNGDRSKILIAAALPNLNNQSASCTKDGRGPVQAFPALLAVSGAIFADLCAENFGSRLADFGQYLIQRVASQKIALDFTPDINSIEVTYGAEGSIEAERQTISKGAEGYYFDPAKNEVILSPTLNLPRQKNGVIFIKATPADLSNYKNGRLKRI